MKQGFISSIHIKKSINISDVEIHLSDFERKHLILTGKNGSGKSTLLKNIKLFLQSIQDRRILSIDDIEKRIDITLSKLEINLLDEYKRF